MFKNFFLLACTYCFISDEDDDDNDEDWCRRVWYDMMCDIPFQMDD